MKTKRILSGTIALVALLLFFSSCQKDLEMMEPAPSPVQTATSMSDMQVDADFDWKTMKKMQIEVKSNTKAVLYIKSKTGTIYHKAMVNYGESYNTSFAVPSYEKELDIQLAGQSRTVSVSDDWISVSFQ